MQSFKDNRGRTWDILVDIPAVADVRKQFNGIDLMKAHTASAERLFNDPVLFCEVLRAVIVPRKDQKKMTDDDFFSAMDGSAIERAARALLDAVADLYPRKQAEVLRNLVAVGEKVAADLFGRMAKDITALDIEKVAASIIA